MEAWAGTAAACAIAATLLNGGKAEVLNMTKKNASQPIIPFHPGEILLVEFLLPAKITQAAFARKIGWTKARLNEFVR